MRLALWLVNRQHLSDRRPIAEDRLTGLLGRAARLLALLLLLGFWLAAAAALLRGCGGFGHLLLRSLALFSPVSGIALPKGANKPG